MVSYSNIKYMFEHGKKFKTLKRLSKGKVKYNNLQIVGSELFYGVEAFVYLSMRIVLLSFNHEVNHRSFWKFLWKFRQVNNLNGVRFQWMAQAISTLLLVF